MKNWIVILSVLLVSMASIDWVAPPVTIKLTSGSNMAITGANLQGYSGMVLQPDGKVGLAMRMAHCRPASHFFVPAGTVYNVRDFGAKGDGAAIDGDAINKAIDAAAAAGGGTVYFPAGKYMSYTIRLKSYISLYFDQGATLIAAAPVNNTGY